MLMAPIRTMRPSMRCRLWQALRGISMTDKPQSVILDVDTSTYFNMMARLMGGAAPPAPEDRRCWPAWPRLVSFPDSRST